MPDDKTVDLAIYHWVAPQVEADYALRLLPISGVEQQIQSDTAKGHWPPREAREVIFMGLMTNLVGSRSNLVIVRTGTIALVTSELLQGE